MTVLSRAQLIRGFGLFLPHLKSYIMTSAFISSEDKDSLVKQLEDVYADLLDAHQRESGVMPYTPSVLKKWEQQRKKLQGRKGR